MHNVYLVVLGLVTVCMTFVLFLIKDYRKDLNKLNEQKQDRKFCETLCGLKSTEMADLKKAVLAQQKTLIRHGECLAKIETTLESVKISIEQRRAIFRHDDD